MATRSAKIDQKADLIWAIADKLTGVYKPHEYGDVILPLTVIRRFDCILSDTKDDDIEFQNDIMFQERDVNLVYYRERQKKSGNEVQTEFAWITNIRITKSNVKKIIKSGRLRWKIENQGFNRQKHWQGNIGHACSWNETAQKNHYLMEQIADFVKQLYEFFFLKKNGIKKLQKEISSELLASFGRQLTRTEDISSELHEAVPN